MRTFLYAECLKLRRLPMLFFAACGVIMVTVAVFLGREAGNLSAENADTAGWYLTMVQPWAVFLVLPALVALFGSYLICREELEHTLNALRLIPVSETRLTAVKLMLTFLFSLAIHLLLFAATLVLEICLYGKALTPTLAFHFFCTYLLEGIGVFLAVSPIITLVVFWKKQYWLALILAETYSFLGLFMSMSNALRALYPITALLGVAGYYETPLQNRLLSAGVLLLCGGASILLLFFQKNKMA